VAILIVCFGHKLALLANMRLEAKRVGQIIDGEAQDLPSGQKMPAVAPTIALLQDHLETIRQAEVHRLRGRLGQLSLEQKLAIEALTQGIISSIMNTPIDILKKVAQESKSVARECEAATIIHTIKRLFNLQDERVEEPVWSEGQTQGLPRSRPRPAPI
jgi:glutamyl-tRNA reductase